MQNYWLKKQHKALQRSSTFSRKHCSSPSQKDIVTTEGKRGCVNTYHITTVEHKKERAWALNSSFQLILRNLEFSLLESHRLSARIVRATSTDKRGNYFKLLLNSSANFSQKKKAVIVSCTQGIHSGYGVIACNGRNLNAACIAVNMFSMSWKWHTQWVFVF